MLPTGETTADGVAIGGTVTGIVLVNFLVVVTTFVAKESSLAQIQTSMPCYRSQVTYSFSCKIHDAVLPIQTQLEIDQQGYVK